MPEQRRHPKRQAIIDADSVLLRKCLLLGANVGSDRALGANVGSDRALGANVGSDQGQQLAIRRVVAGAILHNACEYAVELETSVKRCYSATSPDRSAVVSGTKPQQVTTSDQREPPSRRRGQL